MVEIKINGHKIKVSETSTIMDAANKLGIYIPHFCYHKKLSIAANCRMCLIDIETVSKPLPACATPVTNGMIIHTFNDKAIKAQKSVMEFLLINHPLDCPICDKGGECQLQDLAVGYGSSSSRYIEEKRVVLSKDVGPLISMKEMSRCIHCTRCVRFGQEIAGIMEFGMLWRGENSEITTFLDKTVNSELSGNMIDLCPVGALTSKPFRYSARTWELSRRKSISPHDSLGTNLIIEVKDNQVMRVLPLENEEINECWISDKDRFSYTALNSKQRLTKPMLKKNNQWCEVDWHIALQYVADSLSNIHRQYGADTIAALGTPYSTLEELFLLQKIIRGIGSENIDFRLRQSNFLLDNLINPWLGTSIINLLNLDCIFIIGSFLRKDHPLLSARLRKSFKKNNTIVNFLHAVDDDQLMLIHNKIITAPSIWLTILNEIIVAIANIKHINLPKEFNFIQTSLKSKQIAISLLSGKVKAVLLGNSVVQHPQASQLHVAAQWIAENSHATFGYFTEGSNTVGGYLAKAIPNKNGANALQMFIKQHKAYLLLHVEPELDLYDSQIATMILNQAEIVIIMSAYYYNNIDYADVLLPISPFTETSGTFVNCEGRAQSFNSTVKPLGATRPAWKVLRILGNLLNLSNFDYETSEEIRNEVIGTQINLQLYLNNFSKLTLQPNHIINKTLERIADVPIYFTDSIVRRSLALLQTLDSQNPKVSLSKILANKLQIIDGEYINVKKGQSSAVLEVIIDNKLPENTVRIPAGHFSTACLGSMFGEIFVEKIK